MAFKILWLNPSLPPSLRARKVSQPLLPTLVHFISEVFPLVKFLLLESHLGICFLEDLD